MRKRLKAKLIQLVVKQLLNGIREEDVLRTNGYGKIVHRGKVLPDETVQALQADAEKLKTSVALKLILDDMQYLAQQTMFDKSETFDDMLFGKAQLYVIDILKKKIQNLAD